jgi:hypothetical protein
MEQAAGVISFDFFKANYDAALRRNITTVHVLQGTARVCTALEHSFDFLCRVWVGFLKAQRLRFKD